MRSRNDACERRRQSASRWQSAVSLLPSLFCFAVVVPLFSFNAQASSLLAGAGGSADAAVAGSTIAEPLSPSGAQFSNPAGLAGFDERAIGTGLGVAYGKGEIAADIPAGYSASNEVIVPFLDGYLVLPWDRWTFAVGTMGSSGAKFDYGPRANVGVNDGFFSESGVIGVPLTASYRWSEKLWLGAELIVLYGSSHLRYSRQVAEFPGEPIPFRFTVKGFGVQSMFGVTWKPDEHWSIGLSAKPPGRIWADGDSKLGSGKQDVELELEAPAEAALGITRVIAEDWSLSYAVRFIDTSVLGSSHFHFDDTPSANMPYLTDADDEWRNSLGLEYRWSETLSLLGGFSYANAIVGRNGVSPMAYDCDDYRLNTGLHWLYEAWVLDGSFSYFFAGTRNINAQDALIFPGKFEVKPAYLLSFTITRKF